MGHVGDSLGNKSRQPATRDQFSQLHQEQKPLSFSLRRQVSEVCVGCWEVFPLLTSGISNDVTDLYEEGSVRLCWTCACVLSSSNGFQSVGPRGERARTRIQQVLSPLSDLQAILGGQCPKSAVILNLPSWYTRAAPPVRRAGLIPLPLNLGWTEEPAWPREDGGPRCPETLEAGS